MLVTLAKQWYLSSQLLSVTASKAMLIFHNLQCQHFPGSRQRRILPAPGPLCLDCDLAPRHQ
jgi:hypothetical protein